MVFFPAGYRSPLIVDSNSHFPDMYSGRLLYRSDSRTLWYCVGNKWHRLATADETRKPSLPVYRVAPEGSGFNADYYGLNGLRNAINDIHVKYGGGIISLMPGEYKDDEGGSWDLPLRDNVTLIGNGENTVLKTNKFTLANNVVIENLKIIANPSGLVPTLFTISSNVSNVIVRNCYLDSTKDNTSILYQESNNTTLHNIKFMFNKISNKYDRSVNFVVKNGDSLMIYGNDMQCGVRPYACGSVYIYFNNIEATGDIINTNINTAREIFVIGNNIKGDGTGIGLYGVHYLFAESNLISNVRMGVEGNGRLTMINNVIENASIGVGIYSDSATSLISNNVILVSDSGIESTPQTNAVTSISSNHIESQNYALKNIPKNTTIIGNAYHGNVSVDPNAVMIGNIEV